MFRGDGVSLFVWLCSFCVVYPFSGVAKSSEFRSTIPKVVQVLFVLFV